MLPRETIATARIPGGEQLDLVTHGRDFIIMIGRGELMSSRMQFSEEQLAELTLERVGKPDPRILIGGYGMGFTLRAALQRMGEGGQAVVAELIPEILDWARGPMAEMTGDSLSDPRLTLEIGDVAAIMDDAADGTVPGFDAILLDVDNGPDGLVRAENDRIYAFPGLRAAKAALNPGGLLAIWSAAPDPRFTRRLEKAGFAVETLQVRARPNNKGPRHTIWFARRA
jgi:spermidine synthase